MALESIPTSTNMDAQLVTVLRRLFRAFNRFMLLLWRLDMVWWFTLAPQISGQILVLNHIGRKTGLPRRTPVNFARIDDEVYITAGFGSVSHWYRNIQAQPQIEVWLPDGRWQAIAEDITERPDMLPIMRQVLIGSGFAARVAGINPYTLSDAQLAEAVRGYRLLHLRRTEALAGPGESGDLRWVWQVLTFGLVAIILLRRRSEERT